MNLSAALVLVTLIVASSLQITSSHTDDALQALRKLKRVKRLIGGMVVTQDGQWPWLGHLKGKILTRSFLGIPLAYENLYCGGTIINERWILTAAHCIKMKSHPARSHWPRYWHARVGENDNSPSFWERVKSVFSFVKRDWEIWNVHAEKIILHPRYDENNAWKNDIALMKLEKSLPLSTHPHMQAAVLPPLNVTNWPADGEECVMKGWGCTQEGRGISEQARMASMPKVNDELCESRFGPLDLSTRLCAGYIGRGIGICPGDSGGPLVCKRQGEWNLAGVASFTAAERPAQFPGVFTDVTQYLDWISRTIRLN